MPGIQNVSTCKNFSCTSTGYNYSAMNYFGRCCCIFGHFISVNFVQEPKLPLLSGSWGENLAPEGLPGNGQHEIINQISCYYAL